MVGDKHIDTYSRQDANLLRDTLTDRALHSATVKKSLSTLCTIVNFTNRECGLKGENAVSDVYFSDDELDTKTKRQPLQLPVIWFVQRECQTLDDEARWFISLISNTGMRLSEAAGLIKGDLCLDHKHSQLVLKVHIWRRQKTKGSE